MSRTRLGRLAVYAVAGAVACSTALGLTSAASGHTTPITITLGSTPRHQPDHGGDGKTYSFVIAAPPVNGLYPGAVKRLHLAVYNPYPHALRITELRGSIASTTNPRCAPTASNLVLRNRQGPPALPLTVPARRSTAAGTIPLHMPNTVANECQRVSFTIKIRGTATKASR